MSSSDVVLGIDLGTTNSVVAVADGGQSRVLANELGLRLLPSVVSFKPDGTILVGEEARERRLLDARHTVYSIKRLIGRPYRSEEVKQAKRRFAFEMVESPNGGCVVKIRNETYTLTEISAFVLREIRRIAEQNLGHALERAVLTVPANFNELQRSATKAAGRVAGLEVERIINEPTAAALAYGYGKRRPERVAVFDLGGGTFDLTILELEDDVFEVLSTAGDSFLGGDDLDLAVAEVMAEACLAQHRWDPRQDDQAFERLRAAGEWVKCQLSEDDEVEVTLEELTYGPGGSALDLVFKLDKKGFEDAVRPLVTRAFDVCQQALKEAAMKPHEVDNVVLVGGSTRVPLVREMVKQYFRKEPRIEIDPDLVVAQGAAIHGYALSGAPRKRSVKSTEQSLAKVSLKKISAGELANLKAERAKRKAELPKGPAFAPTDQVEAAPEPPPRAGRPTPPPPPMPGLPPARLPSVGGGVMSLDDPLSGFPAVLGDLGQHDLDAPVPEAPRKPGHPAPRKPGHPEPRKPGHPEPRKPGHPARAQPPPPPPPPPPRPPAAVQEILPSLPSIIIDDPPEAAPSQAQPVLQMAERAAAPLLMDVTPHSLGLETAGGFCQHLIRRNAPIPSEQSRVFTTATDGQDSVVVRICQGEERAYVDNQALGEIELLGLRDAARGGVKIDVTFILDASGVLAVKAVDVDTGKEQRIQVNLKGGADEAEVERMRQRQQRLMQ